MINPSYNGVTPNICERFISGIKTCSLKKGYLAVRTRNDTYVVENRTLMCLDKFVYTDTMSYLYTPKALNEVFPSCKPDKIFHVEILNPENLPYTIDRSLNIFLMAFLTRGASHVFTRFGSDVKEVTDFIELLFKKELIYTLDIIALFSGTDRTIPLCI